MPHGKRALAAEDSNTQLHTIRDLMLSAARRGAWLTLDEIAGLTEIGEASISAQLRHLRKPQHGQHRVEKRRRTRPVWFGFTRGARGGVQRRAEETAVVWEYRVLPPARCEAIVLARSTEREDGQRDFSARENPSAAQSSETREATSIENAVSGAERGGAGGSDSPEAREGERCQSV
jgi:hypothetical protein